MKRTKKAMANIGVVDFDQMEFAEDCLQVFIPVENVSDALQSEINKVIKMDKINYISDWEEWYSKNDIVSSKKWSDQGITIQFISLEILIEDKQVSYKIHIAYEDQVYKLMESVATMKIDLSGHERKIKKLILKGMIDKFF